MPRDSRCLLGAAAVRPELFPKAVAGGACDGFVLAATHRPGAYEDFVRLVVPELQRRGLFRTEYPSSTLRGTLGLERPKIAE